MRLIKLILLSIFGYVAYEFYRGLTEGKASPSVSGGGSNSGSRNLRRALNDDEGRMANMTGIGRGTVISTDDTDGAHASHTVGRGVLRS